MNTPRHSARKLLRKTLSKALALPAPMSLVSWAEARRRLPASVTAKAGPYRAAAAPMMVEPQESFFDPSVQTTVLCMASRVGKTETEMNLTGYTIDHDPCNMLWVYPTRDSAMKWKKEFFNPMVKASPCFRGKIRDARSRDADNTMFSVGFPGGRVSAIGSNSPSAFRQIQAPRVICEEVDAMENGPEGDPVTLAFKRADNYRESVQVVSSSPTSLGRSRIWTWLERSDFRKWFCPCYHCAERQVWMWSHLVMTDANPRTSRLVCERCGKEHNDQQRRESVMAGEWRATKPFTGIRGYWLNGMNSLFAAKKGFDSLLHQGAADFLSAKAEGRAALRTWTNTFLAECFDDDEGEEIKGDDIRARAEDYAPDHLPESVLVLTAGVDLQNNRIEIEVRGYGRDEESWGVEKKVFDGDPEFDEVWNQLDAYLLTIFTRDDGVELKIERAFIDMQFKSQRVLAFCAPRLTRGVYPCRGLNRVGLQVPPLLPTQPSRNNRARIPHWNVGVTVAKTTIYDRLSLPIPGARSMHFPVGYGYDPDHFRQLTAEKRKTRYSFGQAYSLFVKLNAGVRNEALDVAVYGMAALYSLGPIAWQKRADFLKTTRPVKSAIVAEVSAPVPEPVKPPAAMGARRGNWATRW